MDDPTYHDFILGAAWDGDLARLNRLLEEDEEQLNADLGPSSASRDGWCVNGCTALMMAAYGGHDAVMKRLLALGADTGKLDEDGRSAAHWACMGSQPSTLALLLDAGFPISVQTRGLKWTLLLAAACVGAAECVKLLLARGGNALNLDAQDFAGQTALTFAAPLLLQAGADPTLRDDDGNTPLTLASEGGHDESVALLLAARAEPQRPRVLFMVRALADAAATIRKATADAADDDLPPAEQLQAAVAVAPSYVKGRVEQGQQLPRVFGHFNAMNEEFVACMMYALGRAHGGGVHFEGEEKPVGMLPEVFVELLEMIVPKWDPARKGLPLGEGLVEEEGEEEADEVEEEEELEEGEGDYDGWDNEEEAAT